MVIHPLIVGVVGTLFVEAIAFIAYAIVVNSKSNKK